MVVKSDVILGNSKDSYVFNNYDKYIIRLPGIYKGTNRGIPLSDEILERDILILGGIGAGKTNIYKHMISQTLFVMGEDDVMIVFDPKLDFRRFHRKGDSVISNYSDTVGKAEEWNIYMEVVADGWDKDSIELNADEIAEIIFIDEIKNSNTPFFPNAAKDIFAAILKAITYLGIDDTEHRIKHMNNASLKQYLQRLDTRMLNEFLGKFDDLRGVLKYIGNGNSEQALGVLAELQSVTSRLFHKSFGADGRFSVRKFERNKNGHALFVEYDIANGLSFKPIYRVLLDMFLKEALSNNQKGKVYVFCDELKLLPHLSHLEDALNFGRTLGITIVAGIQSMEQLYEMYGEYGGKNIASAFQTTICLHTNNLATREYIKGVHGVHYESVQFVDSTNKIVRESRESHVIEDWDIVNLQTGEAIVGLPWMSPFKFKFERYR